MQDWTDISGHSDRTNRPDPRSDNRRRVLAGLRGEADPHPGAVGKAQRLTALVYIRVSTREQARSGGGDEGYSLPAQRAACVDKAKQLGAEVSGIYTDAGESAKTARRPDLQRMLRDVREHRPTYVIVHKIDRLARNRADDLAINKALRAAGTELVSCSEQISNTPSGKFLYNVMADMAQFYSDNLAQEVVKGMRGKAAEGGTPTLAPLGYLHRREFREGVQVSWVEIDPDRGPLLRWAFQQYATGDWTVERLTSALADKGLTSRGGLRTPSRPIGFAALSKLLVNPYFMGIVSFQGEAYQGKHEPLVDKETWLRVQDVLATRAHRGVRERKHPHYLRGTIFCGTCGDRLIYNQPTGRGGTYRYYACGKKRAAARNCASKAVRVEKIEDGIADLYRRIQLPDEEIQRLRTAVRAELADQTADAHEHAERANRQLARLGDERSKLLQAHYDDVVPADLFKTEMRRLTRAMAAAEHEVASSRADLSDAETVLEQALAVAASCSLQYEAAPDKVRRQMNQGFFEKLWIAQDGSVARAEMTEPFAVLLDGESAGAVLGANANGHHPVTDGDRQSLRKTTLVGLTEALSHPSPQVRRLCDMGDAWRKAPASRPTKDEPTYHRGSPEALEVQLSPAGIEQFVREYLEGATAKELASKHGFGMTATKRLLKRHGARKRRTYRNGH